MCCRADTNINSLRLRRRELVFLLSGTYAVIGKFCSPGSLTRYSSVIEVDVSVLDLLTAVIAASSVPDYCEFNTAKALCTLL